MFFFLDPFFPVYIYQHLQFFSRIKLWNSLLNWFLPDSANQTPAMLHLDKEKYIDYENSTDSLDRLKKKDHTLLTQVIVLLYNDEIFFRDYTNNLKTNCRTKEVKITSS